MTKGKEKKTYSIFNLDFRSLYSCFLLLLLSAEFAGAQSGNGTAATDPNEIKPRFNPSMAIIIIVLISAFFFMGFFSIYIRMCTERESIAGIGRSRRGPRGLDPTVIETFPIFVYSEVKGLKIGKGTLECAVCINEFEDDETLRLLPKCDHVFHPDCIDAWLISHTTCPVCRANLVPESDDSVQVDVEIPHLEAESIEENHGSEINNSHNQVPIRVIADQNLPEIINPAHILNQNCRSRSSRFKFTGKFPRSHSTGHSLVRRGENCERFTLRLPVDVRKQIMSKKLNRTTSCVVFPTEGSTRRGYRSAGEGSSHGKLNQFVALDGSTRSDRWTFSMTPPFFTRSASARSSFKSTPADGEQTGTPKGFFSAVKTPFDCLSPKVDGSEQYSRPLV